MIYVFFRGNGNAYHHLGTSFFIHTEIIPAVKRVEFINGRMSYITLRGHWCDAFVLNVHASTEDKDDDAKDGFCEELDHVFNF
jgi:hypothetical protein